MPYLTTLQNLQYGNYIWVHIWVCLRVLNYQWLIFDTTISKQKTVQGSHLPIDAWVKNNYITKIKKSHFWGAG